MSAGVLVLAECLGSEISPATTRVLAAGQALAQALGGPLLLGVLGDDDSAPVPAVTGAQVDSLWLARSASLRPYTAEAWVQAARTVVEACAPRAVLVAHGAPVREWVPRLAAALQAGVVTQASAVAWEADEVVATKPVQGGAALSRQAITGALAIMTLREAELPEPGPVEHNAPPLVHRLEIAPLADRREEVLSEEAPPVHSRPRLKTARVIVAGGRGVGQRTRWPLIEDTAAALGAAVGCSRPIAESGWLDSPGYQVGLSGTSVAPDLYLAVGISGAPQHLAGISAARTVVAVNNDPNADIFKRADIGVVGDLQEVLPAFIEQVRKLQGTPT